MARKVGGGGPNWLSRRRRSGLHGLHEADIGGGKASDIGCNRRQLGWCNPEPQAERGGQLVDRGGRQQPSLPDLIIAADRDLRGAAVEPPAAHPAADDEVVPAPAVIGAVAVDCEGSAEIRRGEGGDLFGHPFFGDLAVIDRERRIGHRFAAGRPAAGVPVTYIHLK